MHCVTGYWVELKFYQLKESAARQILATQTRFITQYVINVKLRYSRSYVANMHIYKM